MTAQVEPLKARTAIVGNMAMTADQRWIDLTITNTTQKPIWVAQEAIPAYRCDEKARRITIYYGYFEEVYGPYRERYMLPPMLPVNADSKYRWIIVEPALIEKAFSPGYETYVQVRVAAREFVPNRTRGSQDVDGYLKDSFTLGPVLLKKTQ